VFPLDKPRTLIHQSVADSIIRVRRVSKAENNAKSISDKNLSFISPTTLKDSDDESTCDTSSSDYLKETSQIKKNLQKVQKSRFQHKYLDALLELGFSTEDSIMALIENKYDLQLTVDSLRRKKKV
jgi:hypothetical protein